MKLKQYWRELQRRHVVKAGIAYLVVAWLLIQVLDTLLPVFKAPDWVMELSVIVLAVGFPIWLILAWVYDFSWGSIQKTEDVPFDAEVSRKKNIGLNRVIIGGLAIAVILLLVNTFRLSDKVDTLEDEFLSMNFTNSLAILPFEDLSPKQDQRYFSDGLARSIYDRLARYKDLKLISPTSSFQYRDKDVSIEVIAEELDVRYILEGSVQLYGEQYRASINLVDTRDGSTIWSKTFEDDLENVLAAYDEVSENVGSYLNVTLASEDVRKRKVDPEAYVLYLKAKDTLLYYDELSILAADSLIRRSIAIDPSYEHSHYILSVTTLHKGIYFKHYTLEQSISNGEDAAREAIRLNPELSEGYNWLSNWKWHDRDVNASIVYLDSAFVYGPNNAAVVRYASHQATRLNQLSKADQLTMKGLKLDPLEPDFYMGKMYIEIFQAEYEAALRSLEKYAELAKSKTSLFGIEAMIHGMNGNYASALNLIEKEKNRYWYCYYKSHILNNMGKPSEAEKYLDELREFPEDSIPANGSPNFDLAILYSQRNDNDQAFEYLKMGFDFVEAYTELLFTMPEFKNLYADPRWDAYIDRLSEEFNYDFPHRPE